MGVRNDDGVSAIAFCWTLERRDGAGLALTSHDSEVEVSGIAYSPAAGVLPAAVTRAGGLDGEPGEISGALSSEGLSQDDLSAGRWRGARTRLAAVSWDNPGEITSLVEGELGEVSIRDGAFTADLVGAAARLRAPVCPATSPECRAAFGDRACRVDLAGRAHRARVLRIDGAAVTVDRELGPDYAGGKLRFASGQNCGCTGYIVSADGSRIQLRELPRNPVAIGDVVVVREGCDKRFATCRERFSNAVNFRGEPHLPGNDSLTRYPGG